MADPVIVVVGAGRGIGAAVARRFAQAGYAPALIARSPSTLEEIGGQLQAEGFTAGWSAVDITDASALSEAIERFGGFSGTIDHLHFNPSVYTPKDALELTAEQLLADLRTGTAGLLTAVQAAKPFMPKGARITVTGGATADRPSPKVASLGVQKAALRNLVMAIDAATKPDDIRAMSLTVDGTVEVGTGLDPARIADAIFEAAGTDSEFWATEIRFDGRD